MTTQSTPTDGKPTGPLSSVRILDLSTIVLGPLATQMLGDLGAEIIKVEAPEGDFMRNNAASRSQGMGSIHLAINRNKQSIAIDLKTPEGKAIVLDLVKDCDVLIHNMRLGAIKRIGLDYETVSEVKPDIVYCAATGYGQDGPFANKPAFDEIIQASTGLANLARTEDGTPTYSPTLIADKITGMALCNALLAGLFHHARTGEGQYIEVPMFETMVAFNFVEHLGGLSFVPENGPAGYARITSGGRRPIKAADGYIALLPYSEKHWISLFRKLGKAELIARYDLENRASIGKHVRSLYDELNALAATRTVKEWLDLCEELDIPGSAMHTLEDMLEHPHARAVRLFNEVEHPTEGKIRYVRPTTHFSKTPQAVRHHSPRLGEQSRAILAGLGYDEQRIEALVANGIVVESGH
jgi:crotonobetainyl-CoA:carnitine CoA-transferase CaiB-like acyl-CoA transferase